MPPGMEQLLGYGATGVFSVFILVSAWKIGHALWSVFFAQGEDPSKQGYFIKKMNAAMRKEEAAIEREQKQAQFIDVLIGTESRRSALCEEHNRNLVQIGGSLAEHHVCAQGMNRDIAAFKAAAIVMSTMCRKVAAREWPGSLEDVNRYCDEFEREIKRM